MCSYTHLAIGPAECQLHYTATRRSLSRAQTAVLLRATPTWPPPWTKTTPWGCPLHHPTRPVCRTSSVATRRLPLGSCSQATTLPPSVMTRAAPRVLHICCTLLRGQMQGNWVPNLKASSTHLRKPGQGLSDTSARMHPKNLKKPIEPSTGWRTSSPP